MTDETSDLILGIVIVAVTLPALYFAAHLIAKIQGTWAGRVLAPLASVLDKDATTTGGVLSGVYQGFQVRAFYGKCKNDGWDSENSIGFDAFNIEARQVPGQHHWSLKFHVSGVLGQGAKVLHIHSADPGLSERLAQAGVVDAVAQVSTSSEDYVTVAFDAQRKTLTYTDDVSPKLVPNSARFQRQLDLLNRLVSMNATVNGA